MATVSWKREKAPYWLARYDYKVELAGTGSGKQRSQAAGIVEARSEPERN